MQMVPYRAREVSKWFHEYESDVNYALWSTVIGAQQAFLIAGILACHGRISTGLSNSLIVGTLYLGVFLWCCV